MNRHFFQIAAPKRSAGRKPHLRLFLVETALGLACAALTAPQAASFTETGSLSRSRAGHTATLLPNGTVLVAGGYDGNVIASCELYDPATGLWKPTATLNTGRTRHTATLLRNGKVLAAGGGYTQEDATSTCELYDPAAGTWTQTGAMANARVYHTATLLLSGMVLVTAGSAHRQGDDMATAELYDPVTEKWTAVGSLSIARSDHTATLLLNGNVLVAGGAPTAGGFNSLSNAELFNPVAGTWTATGSLNSARGAHRAVLLADGQVLVTGGIQDGNALATAERYDPITGTWRAVGALKNGRAFHSANLLPDGKVLAAGGVESSGADLASAELFDPRTESWTAVGSLSTARTLHSTTLLPNGNVLVAGGGRNSAPVWFSSGELYDFSAAPITLLNPIKLPSNSVQFAFTGLPNGTYSAWIMTSLAAPSDGTWLEAVPEFSPGLFVFSGPVGANLPQLFYRVAEGAWPKLNEP